MLFQARGGMVTEAAINQVDNLNLKTCYRVQMTLFQVYYDWRGISCIVDMVINAQSRSFVKSIDQTNSDLIQYCPPWISRLRNRDYGYSIRKIPAQEKLSGSG